MRNPFNDLIFMFFIIVFLLLILYISLFAYQKKYYPLRISNFEYSTYKSHKNVPEGIDTLTASINISQCPPGQCALDIKTGLKRCAENPTSKLTYNILEEICTRINFCDYKPIPYAVRSDGSATSNVCETTPDGEKVPCRCTNKKTCSSHQLSKFIIIGENIEQNSTKNFQVVQETGIEQGEMGYSSIEIDNPSIEFCQINPGFTDVMINGCIFNNSLQDKLGCQTISSISLDTSSGSELSWEIESDISIGTPFIVLRVETGQDQNIFLPPVGLIQFKKSTASSTASSIEVIRYSALNILADDEASNTGKRVQLGSIINPLISVSLSESDSLKDTGNPDVIGFQTNYSSTVTNPAFPSLVLVDAVTEFCSTPNSEPNYKNMLLCTQSENDICKFGTFSYNFDKLRNLGKNTLEVTNETFSRNFCQYNPGNNIELQQATYLEDPAYYTLSCAIGSGCAGTNFGKNAQQETNSKFFPEVDINGIHGIWEFPRVSTFPVISFDDPSILLDDQTIQPGDFWSMKFITQNLISGPETISKGGTCIVVQDLFGFENYVNRADFPQNDKLVPGVCIGSDSYNLVNAKYIISNGKNINTLSVSRGLDNALPPYSDIRITPPNLKTNDTYGIVTVDNTGTKNSLVLKTIDGETIQNFEKGITVDLVIYKQFSFSGGNYITKVLKDSGSKSNRRTYTKGDGTAYKFTTKVTGNADSAPLPLLPPENIYQLSYSSNTKLEDINLNFYSPQVPFKIPMTMYYPVWNPVLSQQECIRCKPLLLAVPEINMVGNLSNIIIQFSGKDFSNYQYNTKTKKFCYVTTSKILFKNTERVDITSQRIVLQEPNFNINVGDYVLDSTLQMPFEVIPEGDLNEQFNYASLFIHPQIFPSATAKKIFTKIFNNYASNPSFPKPITSNPYPFSFGIEESTSENFIYKQGSQEQTLYPNQIGQINYNKGKKAWEFNNQYSNFNNYPNNYFFGKKYQSTDYYNKQMSQTDQGIYTDGFYFVPTQKVTAISDDRQTVIVDSLFPYKIHPQTDDNEETYIQFCRLDSPLGLCVTASYGTTKTQIEINAISDSRITDIKVIENEDVLLQSNLPTITIDTKNQNFL